MHIRFAPARCFYRCVRIGRFAHAQDLAPNGTVMQAPKYAYRSGLLDFVVRFSVNLKGGPAMTPAQFQSWQQKMLLGVSLKVVAPTGQYDPTRLIISYGGTYQNISIARQYSWMGWPKAHS